MRTTILPIVILLLAGCGDGAPTAPTGNTTSFFVTSATSVTGNLGGLTGADATCQRLAPAAGHGGTAWRAYRSVSRDPSNTNQVTRKIASATVRGTTQTGFFWRTTSPNFIRVPVIPQYSWMRTACGSAANGPAHPLGSSTTS